MVTGGVQGVPVRRLTACKYIQEGFLELSANDFPRCRNDSYLNLKCCNRMPQPIGGCVVIMGSPVPLVEMDYGLFSISFLHKGRY